MASSLTLFCKKITAVQDLGKNVGGYKKRLYWNYGLEGLLN